MLLTIFLAIIFCVAITLMLLSAVAFIQNEKFFSSAPKEARDVMKPREKELFYGARTNRLDTDGICNPDDTGRGRHRYLGRFQKRIFVCAVLFAVYFYIYHLQGL